MNLGRVMTAMVTPYTIAGDVDYAKAQKLAEYLLANGSDALVICGTTGESPVLSKKEKFMLFSAVKEVTKNRAFLVGGGCTGNCTAESVELAAEAKEAGVDAILAVVPYYNKPPQSGIYQHFKTIARSIDLPILLYNIPGRTGTNMLPATVEHLAADCPNIRAIKESSGNMDQVSELRTRLGDDFYIYSGDDSMTLPMMVLGSHGVVSVASHIMGNEIREMINAFIRGDNKEALRLHLQLLPVFKKLFIVTNPIPVKTALNLLGWEMGDCRLPLEAASKEVKAELRDLLAMLGKELV